MTYDEWKADAGQVADATWQAREMLLAGCRKVVLRRTASGIIVSAPTPESERYYQRGRDVEAIEVPPRRLIVGQCLDRPPIKSGRVTGIRVAGDGGDVSQFAIVRVEAQGEDPAFVYVGLL